jgi:hypothetical protein
MWRTNRYIIVYFDPIGGFDSFLWRKNTFISCLLLNLIVNMYTNFENVQEGVYKIKYI